MTALVLLPGMDGSGHFFAQFCQRLGAGIDTIVIAYPPDAALGYRELTDFVRSRLPSLTSCWVNHSPARWRSHWLPSARRCCLA